MLRKCGLEPGRRMPRPAALDKGFVGVGDPCWDRTSDTLIKSQVLYQLS